MNKGGARDGAGRKTIKDKLKVLNFRLSIDDIKIIDRLGVGKNSSEKLRYILKKYKTDKISSRTRRAAYKIEWSPDIDLLNEKFNKFLDDWREADKNQFLLNSSLANIIRSKRIAKAKSYIENNEHFDKLETFNWKINLIDFQSTHEEKYELIFQKEDETITMYFSDSEEDLLDNSHTLTEFEEETFSFLFDELQKDIYSIKSESESENFLDKQYSNGDHYKLLEYGNIAIAEFEYIEATKLCKITTVKR